MLYRRYRIAIFMWFLFWTPCYIYAFLHTGPTKNPFYRQRAFIYYAFSNPSPNLTDDYVIVLHNGHSFDLLILFSHCAAGHGWMRLSIFEKFVHPKTFWSILKGGCLYSVSASISSPQMQTQEKKRIEKTPFSNKSVMFQPSTMLSFSADAKSFHPARHIYNSAQDHQSIVSERSLSYHSL